MRCPFHGDDSTGERGTGDVSSGRSLDRRGFVRAGLTIGGVSALGSALGVTMATGDLGQTVLPPVVGVRAAAIAWQAGLGFIVPLLLLVALGLRVVLPAGTPTETGVDTLSFGHVGHVVGELRRSNMAFVAFILFLYILVWQSFTGFYPTYLVEEKGPSSSTAGVLFSVFFAFGVVVKPVAGAAYDRIGMRSSLVLVLVGPVAGFVLLPLVEGFWPLAAITASSARCSGRAPSPSRSSPTRSPRRYGAPGSGWSGPQRPPSGRRARSRSARSPTAGSSTRATCCWGSSSWPSSSSRSGSRGRRRRRGRRAGPGRSYGRA